MTRAEGEKILERAVGLSIPFGSWRRRIPDADYERLVGDVLQYVLAMQELGYVITPPPAATKER